MTARVRTAADLILSGLNGDLPTRPEVELERPGAHRRLDTAGDTLPPPVQTHRALGVPHDLPAGHP